MNLIEQIISVFAPFDCLNCGKEGELVCSNCKSLLPYFSHNVQLNGVQQVFCRTPYDNLAKDLISKFKFEHAKEASRLIATLMLEVLPDLEQNTWIVPVVTANQRVRQRGYDQSVLLAKIIAKQKDLQFKCILRRMTNIRQMGSNRQTRKVHMAQAYTSLLSKIDAQQPILLIDDVLTTGATIESATVALKDVGARNIKALVFARA